MEMDFVMRLESWKAALNWKAMALPAAVPAVPLADSEGIAAGQTSLRPGQKFCAEDHALQPSNRR